MQYPRMMLRRFLMLACAGACACGSGTSAFVPAATPPGTLAQSLTILNYADYPQHLTVAPGSAVAILNLDAVEHTVTSETVPGTFQPGAVGGVSFDTPAFLGTFTISIPADAPVGTVVPYFCRIHGAAEVTRGEIEIVAP